MSVTIYMEVLILGVNTLYTVFLLSLRDTHGVERVNSILLAQFVFMMVLVKLKEK